MKNLKGNRLKLIVNLLCFLVWTANYINSSIFDTHNTMYLLLVIIHGVLSIFYVIKISDEPKENLEEHKEFLITMYEGLRYDWGQRGYKNGYYWNLYDEALNKLTRGVDPSRVDKWVVNNEKAWREI